MLQHLNGICCLNRNTETWIITLLTLWSEVGHQYGSITHYEMLYSNSYRVSHRWDMITRLTRVNVCNLIGWQPGNTVLWLVITSYVECIVSVVPVVGLSQIITRLWQCVANIRPTLKVNIFIIYNFRMSANYRLTIIKIKKYFYNNIFFV